MIDYVTWLLTNMVAGLAVLAFLLWWGLGREDTRHWAPAFGITGLVATVAGLAMTFTEPIPKPFSTAYGEMSVFLGVLFLGAAWALARAWSLLPLGIYAFVAGLAAILMGVRFVHLSLTPMPLLPGAGFILTGLGGVGAGVVLRSPQTKALRLVGALVLLLAAGLWALTAGMGYWTHLLVQPSPAKTTSWVQPSGLVAPESLLACRCLSLFNTAQVSGTASGTDSRLAQAAITQYMQNARYHAH